MADGPCGSLTHSGHGRYHIVTILFSGCSHTVGTGLLPEQSNYAQLVSNHLNEDVDNISILGSDNQDIFTRTLLKIKTNSYSKAIIQWTYPTRIGISVFPVLEIMSNISASPNGSLDPYALKMLGISSDAFSDYKKYALLLNGQHKNWLDVFLYTDIIATYCLLNNITPIFIDLALDRSFTSLIQSKNYLGANLPDSVKKIFTHELASDHAVQKYIDIFCQLHAPDLWANFNDPWQENWIDKASDNQHPGPRSHQWMADRIISYIT